MVLAGRYWYHQQYFLVAPPPAGMVLVPVPSYHTNYYTLLVIQLIELQVFECINRGSEELRPPIRVNNITFITKIRLAS